MSHRPLAPLLLLTAISCKHPPPPPSPAAPPPSSTLAKQVRAAGFHPAPGLSSSLTPGTLVMKTNGAVFQTREKCFPAAAPRRGPLALSNVASQLSTGVAASIADVANLVGNAHAEVETGRSVTLAMAGVEVVAVAIADLEPSPTCLAALNRQQKAGVGVEHYLLISEVIVADRIEVRDERQLLVDAGGGLRLQLLDAQAESRVERVTAKGFDVKGPVTLGYKCQQLVGMHQDSSTSNAGGPESCSGFGG